MNKTVNSADMDQSPIYTYFVDRQDNGQFDRYNPDMQTFVNKTWNKNLGAVVAMSHSGIGADVTNGFVQFICDNPCMQNRLIAFLSDIRDEFTREYQPVIEIRSKSVPRVKNAEWNDDITHYITVMFRTPRFRSKSQANAWWAKLADCVSPRPQLIGCIGPIL